MSRTYTYIYFIFLIQFINTLFGATSSTDPITHLTNVTLLDVITNLQWNKQGSLLAVECLSELTSPLHSIVYVLEGGQKSIVLEIPMTIVTDIKWSEDDSLLYIAGHNRTDAEAILYDNQIAIFSTN